MCNLHIFGQNFKIRFCQNSIRRFFSFQKSDSSCKKITTMFPNWYWRTDRDSWISKFQFFSLSLAEIPLSGNFLHMGPTLGPGPYAGGAGGAAPRWCILIYTLNLIQGFRHHICLGSHTKQSKNISKTACRRSTSRFEGSNPDDFARPIMFAIENASK